MVVAAPHNPSGGVPHGQVFPPGPTLNQGIRQPGPGPRPGPGICRGPNPTQPERHQQPNMPFFYVQPPQPYVPYQWPMPIPYTPYGGVPGFGYGMMLPQFPPASYVEAPGYILPHTQLHMVDYRRMMTPHMAPTMAYQARRFRYQQTTPSGRVMVSSEVQTELVGADSQHNSPLSSQNTSESGQSSGSGSVLLSPKLNENKSPVCPGKEAVTSVPKMQADMAATGTLSAVPEGGILFQTEEVRIECSGAPSALKIVRSQETGELGRSANGELLQCSMESAEDVVMRCFQSVQFAENDPKNCLEDHSDEPYLPPCPDVLLMRSCPTNGTTLEGSDVMSTEPASSTMLGHGDSSLVNNSEDGCGNTKNIHFKILRLPLELQCLDELHRMEASVWSVESLMPYVPSNEWLIQNGLMTPQKQSLETVNEVPAEVVQQSNLSQDKQDGMEVELNVQHSEVPPESVSACLPSSWLADFGNNDQNKPPDKDQQFKDQSSWPEVPQQTEVKQNPDLQSVISLNSAPENVQRVKTCDAEGFSLSCPDVRVKHKVRLCKNCSLRRKSGVASDTLSPKSSGVKRHKVPHAHLLEDNGKLCGTCRHDPGKKLKCKAISPYHRSPEGSENTVYPLKVPKKSLNRLYNAQSLPPPRHAEKCPMYHQSKLREQNCSCDYLKLPQNNPAWNANGYGHNVTLERNEENLAFSSTDRWRNVEQKLILHQQSDKSWRGSMQVSDTESTKSGGKARTHKHKQSAQSPEIHRRDTRC